MKHSTVGIQLFPERMTKSRVTVSLEQNLPQQHISLPCAPGCFHPGKTCSPQPGSESHEEVPRKEERERAILCYFSRQEDPRAHYLPLSIPSLYSCAPSPSDTRGLALPPPGLSSSAILILFLGFFLWTFGSLSRPSRPPPQCSEDFAW